MLRVFSRHAEQAHYLPYLHNCQHSPSPRTLHRMGIGTGMAESERRYGYISSNDRGNRFNPLMQT
jgi:hypothetical protein